MFWYLHTKDFSFLASCSSSIVCIQRFVIFSHPQYRFVWDVVCTCNQDAVPCASLIISIVPRNTVVSLSLTLTSIAHLKDNLLSSDCISILSYFIPNILEMFELCISGHAFRIFRRSSFAQTINAFIGRLI